MKQTAVYFDLNNLYQIIEEKPYQSIFVLVDNWTKQYCLPIVQPKLETLGKVEIIEIERGEISKTTEMAMFIWSAMLEMKADRKSLLINLGGGVVTDLGGFVASTFKRGIDFINVPTSLLGMVDASIGGKTGVSLKNVKNVVGSIHFPVATIVHQDFLKTLNDREKKSGWAEMIKHALIKNKTHWEDIKRIHKLSLEPPLELIKESIQIKIEIVNQDPEEKGPRKTLNFGHTIGHALESEFLQTEKELLHGEAIAIGILVESILSYENEFINQKDLNEIFDTITAWFEKIRIPENRMDKLIQWMKHDKKNENDQIGFSLIHGIGNCKYEIFQTEAQIRQAIQKYNQKIKMK